MTLLALYLPLPLIPPALALEGGPDGGDQVFTDSFEADGPSHQWIAASGSEVAATLATPAEVSLPFAFEFYGTSYETVSLSLNGVLFFGPALSGPPSACFDGSWVGIAPAWDDYQSGTLQTATLGTWPYRSFVISWEDLTLPNGSDSGRFQVWLLEGRNEAVVVLDDLDFGNSNLDQAAQAVVGMSGPSASLSYSCQSPINLPVSFWTANQSSRPARALIMADTLDTPWNGVADNAPTGRALAIGDINQDGVDDLLVGSPDASTAYLIYRPDTAGSYNNADAIFAGTNNELGAGLLIEDLDGDGTSDLAFGAPGAGSDAGAVYMYLGGAWGGTWIPADADASLTGQSTDRLGSKLTSGDLDGDGYPELILGSATADEGGNNAGRVWIVSGGSLPSGSVSTLADAIWDGEGASHGLGTALLSADLDDDGLSELILGAPRSSRGASDAGTTYLVPGGSASGTQVISSVAGVCAIDGSQSGMHLGSAFAVGDLDQSGLLDLIIGAPTSDGALSDLGRAYIAYDIDTTCPTLSGIPDYVQGLSVAAQLGSTLAAHDLNQDGGADLLLAAPNMTGGATNAGVLYAFLTPPLGATDASEADHLISGTSRAGALGTMLGIARDGDLYPTIVASAPYADIQYTHDGALYQWKYHPDFQDDDLDGFISAKAGGNDCDDEDAAVFPMGAEAGIDSLDGDCDGWVDGEIRVRTLADEWSWDIQEIGATTVNLEDYESFSIAAPVSSSNGILYSNGLVAERRTAGTWPRGARGATLTSNPNQLSLSFPEPIDALSMRFLDPEDTFTLSASYQGNPVVTGYQFQLSANDRTGGEFRGFLFRSSVDSIMLSSATLDTWGADQLQFVPASETDRDNDGWTEQDGDCNDDNADISPDAVELVNDGIDNNCDGIVDGGNASQVGDEASWESEVGIDLQEIDFEAISESETITTQYSSLGASFQDVVGAGDIDGTLAHSTRAALGSSVLMEFEEVQPGVGFYLLDAESSVTIYGYAQGTLLYTLPYTPSSSDEFVGLVFEYGVDMLEIVPDFADTIGVDDVDIGVLGLDDADGDGYFEPDDFDDHDNSAYPGAPEVWYDGVDQNGDGLSDYDQDGDGYDSTDYGGTDCNDTDATISPEASEIWYDGTDQNCDGASDFDQDGDGELTDQVGGLDCDDTNSAIGTFAVEIWYDGIDQNCDAASDFDQDGDGFASDGYSGDDCNDQDNSIYPGATEIWYDSEDQACDGGSDYDQDGDGQDASTYGGTDCNDLDAGIYVGATDYEDDGIDSDCSGNPELDADLDGYYARIDCDDADNSVFPGAPDACYDGIDADCAGDTDFDCDLDGYEATSNGGDDCDDSMVTVFPGATDYIYDGIDQNCDGSSEYDQDGDGFDVSWYGGTDCDDTSAGVAPGANDSCYDGLDANCDGMDDFDCDLDGQSDVVYGGTDCNDADSSIYLGATEIIGDGIDQSCDGSDGADDCTDCDGDGYIGQENGGTDCDDTSVAAYPGAAEVWYNGQDEACDGGDDYDADGDGSQAAGTGGSDCNDQDAQAGPHILEDGCGRGDEDCDGTEDEDCPVDSEDTNIPDDSGDSEGADDSGDSEVADDSGAAGDSWRPQEEEPGTPEFKVEEGCGCDAGGGEAGIVGVMLGLGALVRRRGQRG